MGRAEEVSVPMIHLISNCLREHMPRFMSITGNPSAQGDCLVDHVVHDCLLRLFYFHQGGVKNESLGMCSKQRKIDRMLTLL